jgi:8-oxo-dGTP pyrophosphatase MutT (NUDIX family)
MSFIQNIKKQLSAPLPGKSAQIKMMRTDLNQTLKDQYFDPLKEAKKACVMLLLYPVDDHWCTAVMQRPESPYAHSRQISLPGGRLEDTDQSLEAGAKRETLEEFGIPPKDIQTLGRLSNLYIPVSNFLVHPFVGYLKKKPNFIPDPKEVEAIIEIQISDLMNPASRKVKNIRTNKGMILEDIPYFDLSDKVVWGATAMILNEFIEVLEAIPNRVFPSN